MYTRRKKKTRERISKKEKSFFLYSSEEAQKIFLSLFAFLSLAACPGKSDAAAEHNDQSDDGDNDCILRHDECSLFSDDK